MAKKKKGKNGGSSILARAKKKQKEIEDRNASEYHDLKQGWNVFYILPNADKDADPWKEVQRHGMLPCPKAMAGKDCGLCKALIKRLKKGDTDFEEKWRLKPRGYFNAIRKNDLKKKDPTCLKLLAVAPSVFTEIIDHIVDEQIEIWNPKAAVAVAIKRKGTGWKTRYPKVTFGEAVNIKKYITDDILEALWDLDTIRAAKPASKKELLKAIKGVDADEDEDDIDDLDTEEEEEEEDTGDIEDDDLEDDEDEEDDDLLEEPDDDDEDDEEEEDEDDEEEEDEDDEEEEEEDDEEEEEEEKHKKKKKGKKGSKDKKGKKKSKKKKSKKG
jgi:hypothetical protein